MKWCAAGNGCRYSIAEGTVDASIRLLWQFFCARTTLFWRLLSLIFASHLATGTIPAIVIISRLLYVQGG